MKPKTPDPGKPTPFELVRSQRDAAESSLASARSLLTQLANAFDLWAVAPTDTPDESRAITRLKTLTAEARDFIDGRDRRAERRAALTERLLASLELLKADKVDEAQELLREAGER